MSSDTESPTFDAVAELRHTIDHEGVTQVGNAISAISERTGHPRDRVADDLETAWKAGRLRVRSVDGMQFFDRAFPGATS